MTAWYFVKFAMEAMAHRKFDDLPIQHDGFPMLKYQKGEPQEPIEEGRCLGECLEAIPETSILDENMLMPPDVQINTFFKISTNVEWNFGGGCCCPARTKAVSATAVLL